MSARIWAIKKAIEHLAKVPAHHIESVPVREKFGVQTVWEGVVETFVLIGHPVANRAYGWRMGEGADATYKAVLEMPPVDSPNTAVRLSIVSDAIEKAE